MEDHQKDLNLAIVAVYMPTKPETTEQSLLHGSNLFAMILLTFKCC
jgi:hypothetical protein